VDTVGAEFEDAIEKLKDFSEGKNRLRECSGNVQGKFRKHSVNIQGTFSEHSGNIQRTFTFPCLMRFLGDM
jgi:hypothetical protein